MVITDKQGTIYSDKMKALFDPETRKIRRVIASGDVKIVQEDSITHSERVVYNVADGRVRLVGRPKINFFSFKRE